MAIMSDLTGDRLLPAAVKWPKIFNGACESKWHLILRVPDQHTNLPEEKLLYDCKCEALFARYFATNLLMAACALDGELQDRGVAVPSCTGSSQGLCPKFTRAARKATKDKFGVDDYDNKMEYLMCNGWWDIARPVDTTEDLMDLLQPLLACKSWDWHGAVAAKVLMRWAGLLSIVSLDEKANIGQFTAHMGKPECWQDEGSNYLCYVPLARTLEGLPCRHPSNVNVRYLKGKASWLTVKNIEKEGDQLDQMFANLLAKGKMPTRQTTADACATLNGMQVVSAKVKSLWDVTEAGFKQQAVLLTDFFSCLNPREETPKAAIGLHLNNECIKIQTLELVIDEHNVPQTQMSLYVYDSVSYTLRLSADKAKKQTGANMPAICYKEGATEKVLPALDWGGGQAQIPTLLGGTHAGVVQAACLVCQEQVQPSGPCIYCGCRE